MTDPSLGSVRNPQTQILWTGLTIVFQQLLFSYVVVNHIVGCDIFHPSGHLSTWKGHPYCNSYSSDSSEGTREAQVQGLVLSDVPACKPALYTSSSVSWFHLAVTKASSLALPVTVNLRRHYGSLMLCMLEPPSGLHKLRCTSSVPM